MRVLRTVLLVVGAVLLVWLVVRFGAGAIASSLARVTGWQLALICLVHGLTMVIDTLGWRYAFAGDRVPFHRLLAARIAGEAVNVVSVVATIGGEAMKAWLLRRDVSYEESVPSVIVAKTAITVAQALLLLLGILVAWTTLSLDSGFLTGMLWLLLVEVLAVGGFLAVQVAGLVGWAGRLFAAFGITQAGDYGARLNESLRRFYREHWPRFLVSVGCHFVGWLVGIVETALILTALDLPASLAIASVIDAFGSGIRFATFMVPASLGVLEGANAAVFAVLGLGASAGVVFSLVRRARQGVWIAVGMAVLVLMRVSQPSAHEAVPAARA